VIVVAYLYLYILDMDCNHVHCNLDNLLIRDHYKSHLQDAVVLLALFHFLDICQYKVEYVHLCM
jgi:hypothetical protein